MDVKKCSVCGGKLVEAVTTQREKVQLILASKGKIDEHKHVSDYKCEACGLKYDIAAEKPQILKS